MPSEKTILHIQVAMWSTQMHIISIMLFSRYVKKLLHYSSYIKVHNVYNEDQIGQCLYLF